MIEWNYVFVDLQFDLSLVQGSAGSLAFPLNTLDKGEDLRVER